MTKQIDRLKYKQAVKWKRRLDGEDWIRWEADLDRGLVDVEQDYYPYEVALILGCNTETVYQYIKNHNHGRKGRKMQGKIVGGGETSYIRYMIPGESIIKFRDSYIFGDIYEKINKDLRKFIVDEDMLSDIMVVFRNYI